MCHIRHANLTEWYLTHAALRINRMFTMSVITVKRVINANLTGAKAGGVCG